MKPARFSYVAPATVAAALEILASEGDARVIAGGQSLVPMMNMRLAQPELLVDINRIDGLAGVRVEGDALVIGALTRHADLAANGDVKKHAPILAHAAGTVGHYAIRQRGTLGGSLAHADPAAQLPLVCILLDAEIEATSAQGSRRIAAADFFESLFTTTLDPTELITAIRIPIPRQDHGWGFRLFNRRSGDFAEVSAAALVLPDDAPTRVKLAIGAVASVAARVDDLLPPIDFADPDWAAKAAVAVSQAATIEDNARMSVSYRREVLQALIEDVLRDATRRI